MPKRKRNGKSKHLLEKNIFPDSAGIDIGAELIVAAVPTERNDERPVRSFGSFTSDLHALRDWLLSHRIKTVAMESTGVYWVVLFGILEDAGIDVCLVNARHVKGVPGKKTDVCDAQWLQHLHTAGLLKASFRPRNEVLVVRNLVRHRDNLISDSSRRLQQIQKCLNEMNLQIHHVFSDLDGVTGMRILQAILNGERNPEALWSLRDHRVRAKKETFLKAMEGNYLDDQLFILRQHHTAWKQLQELLRTCDEQIKSSLGALHDDLDDDEEKGERQPLPPQKKHRILGKNSPQVDIYQHAYQSYGVDLSTIDGVSSGCLTILLSELGNRSDILGSFRNAKAFCAWLGLSPDNQISGGKVLKSKTKPVANRVAKAFRLCAFGLGNADGEMGQYARRMKGRLGKAEGIVAVAHKVARLVYSMIKSGQPYDPQKAFRPTDYTLRKKEKTLRKIAKELNMTVVPVHA